MDLQEQLFKTIELLIDAKINNTPFNTCIEGVIISDTPEEDGSYKFEYQGQVFNAFPLSNTQIIKKGDWVYILIIGNDFSGKKIILTTKNKEQEAPINIYNEIAKLQTGINYLKNINYNEWYELKSSSNEQIIQLEYDTNILKAATFASYIRLVAEIESDLNENYINGDYGLRITFKYQDNTIKTYQLNLLRVTGNPYKAIGKKEYIEEMYLNSVPISVEKVELFIKGFNNDNSKYVKFRNMRIEFVDDAYADLTRRTPYTLIIESNNGTVFNNTINTITLNAKVYKDGVEVTNNLDNNMFKWKRVSSNQTQDAWWNDPNNGKCVGKSITLTSNDFENEATFYCYLEE